MPLERPRRGNVGLPVYYVTSGDTIFPEALRSPSGTFVNSVILCHCVIGDYSTKWEVRGKEGRREKGEVRRKEGWREGGRGKEGGWWVGVREDGRGTEERRREEGRRKDKEEWRRASNKERNEVIERKGMTGGKRRARGEIRIRGSHSSPRREIPALLEGPRTRRSPPPQVASLSEVHYAGKWLHVIRSLAQHPFPGAQVMGLESNWNISLWQVSSGHRWGCEVVRFSLV